MYPMIDIEKTGQNIKNLCEMKGISVSDVQEFLGLSCNNAIYRWFNGTSLPSLDHLYALQELLGIGIDRILIGSFRKTGRLFYEVTPCGLNLKRLFETHKYFMKAYM